MEETHWLILSGIRARDVRLCPDARGSQPHIGSHSACLTVHSQASSFPLARGGGVSELKLCSCLVSSFAGAWRGRRMNEQDQLDCWIVTPGSSRGELKSRRRERVSSWEPSSRSALS